MRILNPNAGESFIQIPKSGFYVEVTDYKAKSILRKIKIGYGKDIWMWVSFDVKREIDLTDINDVDHYDTFDKAINRSVNDPYSTIYLFDNWEEVLSKWDDIKYQSNITTVYKAVSENPSPCGRG